MKSDARSWKADVQQQVRTQAVRAVLSGKRQVEVAVTFGVTRQAVGKWMVRYKAGGVRQLRARKRGRPMTGGRLSGVQAAAVVRLITDRCPEQLKLPFALWTRGAVQMLIRRRFGIGLSLSTVGRCLARWGFTPQKPRQRAYERDPEAIERWLREQYPAIRAAAKRQKARIYWGDEMGLRSDHQGGRSYAPRGQTPVIPGTGRRFGCNMISAITNRGHLTFMIFKTSLNERLFIRFLRRLCRQTAGRKLFLIVDSHPVHRGGKVARWVATHARQIRLFFLPGYSPELNPDEILNQDVKANTLTRRRPRHVSQLMRNVRGFLGRRRDDPERVRRYFREPHVRYAAA